MEGNGEQEPDAESFKPVSSLRAKFESLHEGNARNVELLGNRNTPALLKPQLEGGESPATRASLDLPRSLSLWTGIDNDLKRLPQTPDRIRGGSESPTKLGHKRPMSMVTGSSPQVAPSVQVHSPKSPPPQTFFTRPTTSPERSSQKATVAHSSVPSQYPSRESTRTPSPGALRVHYSKSETAEHQTYSNGSSTVRSRSPMPPPINRADKPKLAPKPQISMGASELNLSTEPSTGADPRKVSPFNTPPSSDEESTEPTQRLQQVAIRTMQPPPSPRRSQPDTRSTAATAATESLSATDPRFMGFAAPRLTVEKRDARSMGFSPAPSPRTPSRENRGQPHRADSDAASWSSRDPRLTGFTSTTSAAPQHEPTALQPRRSSTQERSTKTTPPRDARLYGFSAGTSSIPSTPVDDMRPPDLPLRSTPRILAPPRPSEDSKRPVYTPGIARSNTSKIPSTSPVVQQQPRHVSDVLRHTAVNTNDVKFPPPLKRSTFEEESSRQAHQIATLAPVTSDSRRTSLDYHNTTANDSDEMEADKPEPITARHEYPDATQTNRRPPISSSKVWRIDGKTDGKTFAICGRYLCTAGYHTRVFDLENGQCILDINHGEAIKVTAVCFKPGETIETEGKRLWIGNTNGDIQEIDIEQQEVTMQSTAHNRRVITNIFRHQKDLWTLDDSGSLCIWPADESGVPSLRYSRITHRLHRPPTFAMVVYNNLWVASGKDIRIYKPSRDGALNLLKDILVQSTSGDITCGTYSDEDGGRVYIGHGDGKLTIYSTTTLTCLNSLKISDYKFTGLEFVQDKLWAVFKTGKVYVYDTSCSPWRVIKDWRAHDGPAVGIAIDYSGVWTLGRLQVVTSGHEGLVKLWDGWLEDDAIDDNVRQRDVEFCTFRNVRVAVTTWNVGAVNPASLRTDFVADAIHASDPDPPEILVFGFQEVVDLEDKSVTAKSILGFSKRKDSSSDTQHQSRVYRDWRDYLSKQLAHEIPNHYYVELHTSSLIGLFFCIFVRQDQKQYVSGQAMSNVKCGMSGHYGNKGALVARFSYDSTSLCFLNCHLAAGQSHTSQRNNDVAKILESDSLPSEPDLDHRSSLYVGGGDGAQILDHEICILNGDLNYRIDAIPRDTVLKLIAANDLAKLLERDQIMVSRKRVSGFRLAPFTESAITFAPTYKYDVGKDSYDSSDKKRSPAWCDRILYRGPPTRIKQLEYKRHDGVRYSDHRPVSGLFRVKVRKIDGEKRRKVYDEVVRDFDRMKRKKAQLGCIRYLVEYFGIDEREARKLIIK